MKFLICIIINLFIFSAVSKNCSKEDYETALKKVAESESAGVGKLIHPLRLAVSGVGGGPGVYDILVIIGKEKTISRINKAIAEIKP